MHLHLEIAAWPPSKFLFADKLNVAYQFCLLVLSACEIKSTLLLLHGLMYRGSLLKESPTVCLVFIVSIGYEFIMWSLEFIQCHDNGLIGGRIWREENIFVMAHLHREWYIWLIIRYALWIHQSTNSHVKYTWDTVEYARKLKTKYLRRSVSNRKYRAHQYPNPSIEHVTQELHSSYYFDQPM